MLLKKNIKEREAETDLRVLTPACALGGRGAGRV